MFELKRAFFLKNKPLFSYIILKKKYGIFTSFFQVIKIFKILLELLFYPENCLICKLYNFHIYLNHLQILINSNIPYNPNKFQVKLFLNIRKRKNDIKMAKWSTLKNWIKQDFWIFFKCIKNFIKLHPEAYKLASTKINGNKF